MDPIKQIAVGEEPVWRETFEHPEYGDLEFSVERSPRVRDWLAQQVLQQQIAPGLADVGGVAGMLPASCAGILTLMKLPVVDEATIEDPDTPGHATIKRTFYDPLEDEHIDFPVLVWASYFKWRADLADQRDALKNSSGAPTPEPSSPSDSESSPAGTAPYPLTPESGT